LDLEVAEVADGRVDDALGCRGVGNVTAHGDRPAPGRCNGGDDTVRTLPAGRIIDDDCRAFGGECFGDGGTNTFGGTGHDGYFSGELIHVGLLVWLR
jgi:hypothetical protein